MLTPIIFFSNFVAQAQEYNNLQEAGSIRLPDGVTPDFIVPSNVFLSFRPNPIGVNQTILINIWMDPPLHVSRYHTGYRVIITNPSGQVNTVELDSYRGDSTSWLEWWVDQIGTWTIEFEFLGSYFPAGNYSIPEGTSVYLPRIVNFNESCYYSPATTGPQELIVQENPVYSWPPADLPDEYWTRPVAFENREWESILGNYPWRGPGGGPDWPAETNTYYNERYDFIPYVEGPETGHIVWRRQDAMSGIIGGEVPHFQMSTSGSNPNIIYCGRCYSTRTKVVEDGSTQLVWESYDLRTGEVYWEKTGITQVPSYIEYDEGYGEIPGAAGRAFGDIGYVSLVYIGNGRLIKYDPFTGDVVLNASIAPMTSGTYYMNRHVLTVQSLGEEEYRLINWTTSGQPAEMGTHARNYAIISNTSYAMNGFPTLQDWESGLGASFTTLAPPAMGGYYGSNIQGYDLISGEKLWEKTIDDTIYVGSCAVADHGKVAILMKGGYFLCWDLKTGDQLWKSELMDYPWGESSFGGYSMQSAYGMLFRESYDGVYAFDWDDGSIVWKYEDPANPYETPYINENGETVYSFDSDAVIADGKLYTINNEHTPTPPITRGWGVNCIDAYTGERIWKLAGVWVWAGPGPISDGYMTVSSSDGYTYAFGKGPTTTTLSASPKVSVHGTSVLLEGSVFDISPGAKQNGIVERFPNGLPAVDVQSVSSWMEYVYLQHTFSEDIKGVEVKLEAIDPNSNNQDLGTATTDINGNFGFAFEPEIPGIYKIIATFEGSDAYYLSSQTTYITVDEALSPATPIDTEEPEVTVEPTAETAFITTEIAVIIVVSVILGVAAFFVLRRRE
jgi:hypothetical protein